MSVVSPAVNTPSAHGTALLQRVALLGVADACLNLLGQRPLEDLVLGIADPQDEGRPGGTAVSFGGELAIHGHRAIGASAAASSLVDRQLQGAHVRARHTLFESAMH